MPQLAILTLLAISTPGWAMFAPGKQVPVDRLVKNISTYVKQNPQKADGYYALGRVHYLAVAMKSGTIGVWSEGDANQTPSIKPQYMQSWGRREEQKKEPAPTLTELAEHIQAATENFQKAIELDPKNPLYTLSYASVMEAAPGAAILAIDRKGWMKVPPDQRMRVEQVVKQLEDPDSIVRTKAEQDLRAMGGSALEVLTGMKSNVPDVQARMEAVAKGVWDDIAIEWYAKAFHLAAADDLQIQSKPIHGLNEVVSYEAASRYMALTEKRGRKEAEVALAEKMTTHKKTLDAKPPGPITPIVFSPAGSTNLQELASDTLTRFDLDGTARGWAWSWVKPTTGILVWDPKGEGKITSGRELFGNVTFGLIWRDGYAALASLDDNHNGELRGDELKGLALWFDRNANGISDPGEVIPVATAGVTALSVRDTGKEPTGELRSDAGVQLKDGTAVPSYDWVSQPQVR